ncbi:MAG: hypothetical protein QME74_08600 [Candidatus Edwardsbacteria bacterium]|nr:hypothetical protein [Candidatus Edwardsbacteria bacterium]
MLIENTEENVQKIRAALGEYIDSKEIDELDFNLMRTYPVVRVGLQDFFVDLLAHIGGIDYPAAKKDMYYEPVRDVMIPVAGLETMIKLKQGYREIDYKDRLYLEGKRKYLQEKEGKGQIQ